MGTAAAIILFALALAPAEPRPSEPCNRKVEGRLWPEKAGLSPAAMRQSARCGQLYVCERGNWRHQWRQVAVPYWQLTGKPRPVQCDVPFAE
jgi:hypothetical protein